jgi:Ca-activated chloride channel homolog
VFRFEDPQALFLLLFIPGLIFWYLRRLRHGGTLQFSRVRAVRSADGGRSGRLRHAAFTLRTLGLTTLVLAFARPQTGITDEQVTTEGVDIVLALDVSSSMLAEDMEPNRLEAAKQVAASFIQGRTNDRIGLVIFAGDAYTQAPLTLDYGVVTTLLGDLQVGMIVDGTAVGMGLATAVKRLQAGDAESKVVVLLTDGRSNRGEIGPVTAAQMAQALGIRVYTIGAGSLGTARIPVNSPGVGTRYAQVRVDVDEETLQEMADVTGGRYFRATDRKSLEEIWDQIDELERTEIEVQNFTRYGELFHWPLAAGVLFLTLELGLGHTVLRKLP